IQEDTWGYYTFLAADRLALTRKEILKKRDLREETKPSGKKSRKRRDETESVCLPLERVKRLAKLRLKEFVDAELAYARQVCPRHQVQTMKMARFGLKQDHYALAYSYAIDHDALNRGGELLRWAYPKAHPSFVQKETIPKGLDPFLIYSIMRQESRFRPDAVSWVGALGLMQLMPATAEQYARKLGGQVNGQKFDQSVLGTPETNLKLAITYLKKLEQEFAGQLPYMLAAYNAGEGTVHRWKKERPNLDLEEFVEEISYPETRDYVKRITANYRIYQLLYR
ncbi:MAG: lytic transglycosylase domain-containing protein, partial [bacterium]|nr:lytic transglycosylase domain-containing protein [bacterium]